MHCHPCRWLGGLHGPWLLPSASLSCQPAVPGLTWPTGHHPGDTGPCISAEPALFLRPHQVPCGQGQHTHHPRGEPLWWRVSPLGPRSGRGSLRGNWITYRATSEAGSGARGGGGSQEDGHRRLLMECQGRQRSSLRYSHLENMLSKAFGIFMSKVLLFPLGDRWKEWEIKGPGGNLGSIPTLQSAITDSAACRWADRL